MKNKKEKAIDLILLGLALQITPSIILIPFSKMLKYSSLSWNWDIPISCLTLGLFLGGYVYLIKGCCLYIESKGYFSWKWLGFLSLLGLSIFLIIPSKKNTASLQDENLSDNPFDKINIPEFFLFLIALSTLYFCLLGLFCLLNNLDFRILTENLTSYFMNLVFTAIFVHWLFLSFYEIRLSGLDFNKIISYKNGINWKLILIIVFIEAAFFRGFDGLTLYNLSFIFPKYVEEYINKKAFTNIPELLSWGVLAIFLVPLIEEIFWRGVVLQKWGIKWGVKAGILYSSLFFTLYHFRFNIIPLFIAGILYSILYLKTSNLMNSILCHSLYNSYVVLFKSVNYFSKSAVKKSTFMSIRDYQDLMQPLLGQLVFLVAISAPLLVYFIYKNFPKNNAIIPYYANNAKTHEAN